jgi:hypothetical protein
MGRLGNTSFGITLGLIKALLLIVYSSHAQNVEGIGQQKPVKITGMLAANLMFFDAQGRPANREKFTWFLTGSPTLEIYGITFPFSFTVSEQQRDFRQPFNQFGVSPYYKWVKAHIGFRNVVFSPFTLGGHTMAGGGVELTPGKFRFGFMYGRLYKAIQAIGNPDGSFVETPSFRRIGASMKIGYGTEQNFVDFILLKAQDDKSSIDYQSTQTGLTPAENLVVGVYTKQKFLKNFQFEFEFSQSVYTHNTDLTDPDTVKGGFLTKPFSFLMDDTNTSTTYNNAMEGSLAYGKNAYNIRLKYREVGPDYQSMGAYFFQNDVRNITIEPSFNLLKSALTIGGSFGYQTDNLNNLRASTTKRKIGSVMLNARIGNKYTGNLSYANYDIGQAPGTVQLDTLIQISQTTQSWGMLHNLAWLGERLNNNIMVTYNYQTLNDRNPSSAEYTNYNTSTWLASYLLSFIKMKLTLTGSYALTTFKLPSKETMINGPTLAVTKTFFKNALNINLTYSSLAYKIDDEQHQTINRISVNTTYRVAKKHRLNLRFYINESAREAENVESFRETKGDIGYAFTF